MSFYPVKAYQRAARLLALAFACWIAPAAAATLENASIRIEIDDQARVVAIIDKRRPGFNLVGAHPEGFWRLNVQRGTSFENIVRPEGQRYDVRSDGKSITVSLGSVKLREEELPIGLAFRVSLVGDEIHWSATVQNRSDYTVAEVYLPEIGGLVGLGDAGRKEDLFWPEGVGRRIADFKSTMRPNQDALVDLPIAVNPLQDPYLEITYPSKASMSWTTLNNGARGLYFAAHDPAVLTGALRAGKRASNGDGLFFSYVKYPFVAPGATWTSPDYVVSPYEGDWHVAADKYRRFLETWRTVREKPEWVRNMQGLFLVILRQQYGDVLWRYSDLPYLYAEARKNGLDTVGLFGWTEAGHDNRYPELHADPAMGGDAALRDGLAAIKAQGGKSILYLQGHLIDPTSKEYPDATRKYGAVNIWGTPYYEYYSKYSQSSFMKNFSMKAFTPACPSSPGWSELMIANGKRAMTFDPTGLIYDQIGGMPPYPCFNKELSGSPTGMFISGRLHLLDALRTNLRNARPDTGFMAEWLTDAYSQYIDVIHCYGVGCWDSPEAFPNLYRYTVPDTIMTSRHPAIRPDRDQVNYAFTYGLRFELEIRYRDEQPVLRESQHVEMSDYLRQLTEVRGRHWPLLGTGRFLNEGVLQQANPKLRYALYGNGDERAVIAWNARSTPEPAGFSLPGYATVEVDGTAGPRADDPSPLQPQEIRVWILRPAKPGSAPAR